jgi:hypothetical protein
VTCCIGEKFVFLQFRRFSTCATSTFNDKTLSAEIEAFVAEFKDCPISTVQSLFREIRQDFVPKNALLIELTKMKNRKQ